MKTMKLLIMGVLLMGMVSLSEAGVISTLTGTSDQTGFVAKFKEFFDPVQLAGFTAAFEANKASATPMEWEAFMLDYMSKNPAFQTAFSDALTKAKEAEGITSEEELIKALQKQITDLKKQIEDMKNLPQEDKDKYLKLLDQYKENINSLLSQLASSQNAVAQAIQAASSTQAQKQDPMQMIMMMMMMMMMMKGGK